MLLISAYTGIGSGRWAAARTSAMPPWREPVKPTALMAGLVAKAWPMVRPSPCSSENTPSGKLQVATAAWIALPTSSEVPGWAPWALTITGQPAASADAVSPPPTENASGKLLAPNTTTGPRPILRKRRSGRGGVRSGSAESRVAPAQRPSRTTLANRRSWPTVRPRSPSRRACGRPDSRIARSISAGPRSRMFWAICSRKAARCSGDVSR